MPRETILPYEKLQDFYVDQDIFVGCSRIYCDISFRNRSSYRWVNKKNAEAIGEIILENIRKSKMK
ncbi:MAG: hypothetical protein QXG91_04470 [Candidatus Aenigmatarchaeota archaeon]